MATALAQILTHYYTGTDIGHLAPGRTGSACCSSRGCTARCSAAPRTPGRAACGIRAVYLATAAKDGQIALESEHGRLLTYLPAPLTITSSATDHARTAPRPDGVIDGRYRGSLQIIARGRGLDVINRVGLESYVRGVVPAESPPTWPAAELEAQAIAARSYALDEHPAGRLRPLRRHPLAGVRRLDAETPATNAAVAATIGQVVTYAGAPVTTYYFASSGGETEDVQNAFAGAAPEPYLTAVLDPFDGSRFGPITMTRHQAARKLRGLLHGTLESIVVTATRCLAADPHRGGRRQPGHDDGQRADARQRARPAQHLGLLHRDPASAEPASGWDRACAKPTRVRSGPSGPSG